MQRTWKDVLSVSVLFFPTQIKLLQFNQTRSSLVLQSHQVPFACGNLSHWCSDANSQLQNLKSSAATQTLPQHHITTLPAWLLRSLSLTYVTNHVTLWDDCVLVKTGKVRSPVTAAGQVWNGRSEKIQQQKKCRNSVIRPSSHAQRYVMCTYCPSHCSAHRANVHTGWTPVPLLDCARFHYDWQSHTALVCVIDFIFYTPVISNHSHLAQTEMLIISKANLLQFTLTDWSVCFCLPHCSRCL